MCRITFLAVYNYTSTFYKFVPVFSVYYYVCRLLACFSFPLYDFRTALIQSALGL